MIAAEIAKLSIRIAGTSGYNRVLLEFFQLDYPIITGVSSVVKKRARIAILMEFPTALGGERSMLAALEKLRDDFEFLILAPPSGSLAHRIQASGLIHVPIDFRDRHGHRRGDEFLVTEIVATLKQFRCQLLHANSLTVSRFVGRYETAWQLPVTGHLRDIMRLSTKGVTDLNRLAGIVAVSQATADYYQQQGLAGEQMVLIYNGIDTNEFQQPARFNLRKELHLADNCPVAVTIGQICLRKGQDLLLQAVAELAGQLDDWQFLILGERYSTKTESIQFVQGLEQICENADLTERIHWLGYLDDVPSVLQQSSLLIHPARQEPFGRVLLEAAAASVPILATAVGGTGEMLTHQKEAYLFEKENVSGLVDGFRYLNGHPQLATQFAQAARQRVATQFSIQDCAEKLNRFWREKLG